MKDNVSRALWIAAGCGCFGLALVGAFLLLHDVAPHWADPRLVDPAQHAQDVGRIRTAILAVLAGTIAATSAVVAALSLRHAGRVHRATQDNEIARRAGELYASAAVQLGSETAAVRLAGVYTFERLAQQEESLRQTIVDVFCAYLRIPGDASPDGQEGLARGELEVRLALQHVLQRHLRPGDGHWKDVGLDLRGAQLIGFDLTGADIGGVVDLRGAHIRGGLGLVSATFRAPLRASDLVVKGNSSIAKVVFHARADFARSRIEGSLQGSSAHFLSDVSFLEATVERDVIWADASFAAGAIFARGRFAGMGFFDAEFSGRVQHRLLTIGGDGTTAGPGDSGGPIFSGATFTELSLRGATFHPGVRFDGVIATERLTTVSGTAHVARDGNPVEVGALDPLS